MMEEKEEKQTGLKRKTATIIVPFAFCDHCTEFSASAENAMAGLVVRCYHQQACLEAVSGYIGLDAELSREK